MDGFTVHSLAPGWEGKGKQDRVFEPAQSPAYGGVSGEEFLRAFLRAARGGEPGPAPIDAAGPRARNHRSGHRVFRYRADGADWVTVGAGLTPRPHSPSPSDREGESARAGKGGRRIGRATALALAGAGAGVCVIGEHQEGTGG